jgi:hypothetical protein
LDGNSSIFYDAHWTFSYIRIRFCQSQLAAQQVSQEDLLDEIDAQRRRAMLILVAAATSALTLPSKAFSQDLNVGAEITKIMGSIGTELGSPLARLGLVSFAGWFRAARIAMKPLGYEGEKPFVEGSQQALTALYGIVPTFKLEGTPDQDSQLVSGLSDAFSRNASSIKVVFESVRNYAEPLKTFSDEQFIHFQLTITLMLYQTKKEVFNLASNITFIYPMC